MPSRINSTTTSPGGLISTGDSDNSLLIQTGDTTAITISNTQVVSLTNPLPVGSGGTGGTTGLTALNASNLTSGTVPDARFPATLPAASGANLTSLNASNLSSGTVGTARLASGTANNTTFLRGDQTWATVAGGVTSLNGQTGAITNTDLYAIGSYVTGRPQNITNYAVNTTIAGSSIYATPPGTRWWTSAGPYFTPVASGTNISASCPLVNTGTWRCVSPAVSYDGDSGFNGLWVRIS